MKKAHVITATLVSIAAAVSASASQADQASDAAIAARANQCFDQAAQEGAVNPGVNPAQYQTTMAGDGFQCAMTVKRDAAGAMIQIRMIGIDAAQANKVTFERNINDKGEYLMAFQEEFAGQSKKLALQTSAATTIDKKDANDQAFLQAAGIMFNVYRPKNAAQGAQAVKPQTNGMQ